MKPSQTSIQVHGEMIILATESEEGEERGLAFSPYAAFQLGKQLMLVAKQVAAKAARAHQN